jgi:hypothetical protein
MIPLPKPRGFWDYGLFALAMTGGLSLIFWLHATAGVGLGDVVIAFAASLLFVFGVIVARRKEKAKWIARPTWRVSVFATLGAYVMMFGAVYADTYFLHRADITPKRLRRDAIVALTVLGGMFWGFLRRAPRRHQFS